MRINRLPLRLSFALVLPTLVAACHGSPGDGESGDAVSSTQIGPRVAELRIDSERRATRGDLAAANLQANVRGTQRHLERTDDPGVRARLLGLLGQRSSMLGAYDDFSTMDTLTALPTDSEPSADQLLARAGFLARVHRFQDAQDMLARARDAGADEDEVQHELDTIGIALGEDIPGLLTRAEQRVAEEGDHDAYVALAMAQWAKGDFVEADESFRTALAIYEDTSPFLIAWHAFQRGVMWGESADRPDLARPLYEEAVRRLPSYVVANTHLAELEAGAGETERARNRLGGLVNAGVGDPEPAGRLAEISQSRDAAAALAAEAEARYETLLARYPEAFADHGSEFFAGAGNAPQRALALALENLNVRKNPRAYVVALGAAEAAGEADVLCRLATEARSVQEGHPVLQAELFALRTRCPD